MFFILLFLSLNSHIFFNLSNIIKYIHNYLVDLDHIKIYYNIIKKMTIIFEIRSIFTSNLIKVVKKK